MRSPQCNLSVAMQRLGSMFTKRFNRIEKVDGSIFRGRFKSRIVGQDEYLRQLCRYIHRNPVAAGLVQRPIDYKWSTYPVYAGLAEPPPWLTVNELPTYFPGPHHLANLCSAVESDMETEIDKCKADELFTHKPTGADGLPVPSRCISQTTILANDDCAALQVGLQEVIENVTNHYKIDKQSLLDFKPTVPNIPRDMCIFLARETANMKVNDIAAAFSLSRTAASSAIARIKNQLPRKLSLLKDIQQIKASCGWSTP